MNAGFGSWLFSMLLGVGALGGMLGMPSSMFIALAATTSIAALLYTISGFGFAVLAAPLFLLFDPARAIQLVIIISTALSSSWFQGCCRQSRRGCYCAWRWAVLSVCRSGSSPSVMRSDPGAGGRWGHDLWLRRVDGGLPPLVEPTRPGHALDGVCDEPRPRSRRRGRLGHRQRGGGDGRAAGADLPAACRGGGEDRARDAPRVLRALTG